NAEAVERVEAFAQANGLPIATSFRRQDYFNNNHPCYAGDVGIGINPKLAQRVKEADVLLVMGARLGEMPTSGYTLLDIPKPKQKLVHVHADAGELGRVYQPDLAINAGPRAFAAALAKFAPLDGAQWRELCAEAHRDFEAWQQPVHTPGSLQMAE